MHFLVVDDSAVTRKIIIGMLERMEDAHIDQAENGQEAVEMAAVSTYDLILLDWNMPEKLGIDALKEIRQSGNEVPIIMITTEAEKENIVLAINEGANNYIIKPFTPNDVLERIKSVIPDFE